MGLELEHYTTRVALAKIQDILDVDFWDKPDLGKPTEKQVALASKFGYDISGDSRRVGEAIIADIMEQLNLESIENQSLKTGNMVRNIWDSHRQTLVISSIQEDGLIYFKGGNGKKAWARNLVKIEELSG